MLGLSGYDSSDDETEASQPAAADNGKNVAANEPHVQPSFNGVTASSAVDVAITSASRPQRLEEDRDVAPADAPQLGPSMPVEEPHDLASGFLSAPSSPYSAARQAVRNLTLPPVPNFNIPPSPPGSPTPGSNEKFARFLDLKKKGVHFNEKLENSSALRNPSLLQKLREFAGIDDEEQYTSSLPAELAVPRNFPDWAYADQLNKMQADMTKRKEKERAQQGRDAVDFVPASETASGSSSRGGTPGFSTKTGQKSTSERIMAGLDRDRTTIPSNIAGTKRTGSGQRRTGFAP